MPCLLNLDPRQLCSKGSRSPDCAIPWTALNSCLLLGLVDNLNASWQREFSNLRCLSNQCCHGEAHRGKSWKSIALHSQFRNGFSEAEKKWLKFWHQKCHIKKKVERFGNGVPVSTLTEKTRVRPHCWCSHTATVHETTKMWMICNILWYEWYGTTL